MYQFGSSPPVPRVMDVLHLACAVTIKHARTARALAQRMRRRHSMIAALAQRAEPLLSRLSLSPTTTLRFLSLSGLLPPMPLQILPTPDLPHKPEHALPERTPHLRRAPLSRRRLQLLNLREGGRVDGLEYAPEVVSVELPVELVAVARKLAEAVEQSFPAICTESA